MIMDFTDDDNNAIGEALAAYDEKYNPDYDDVSFINDEEDQRYCEWKDEELRTLEDDE